MEQKTKEGLKLAELKEGYVYETGDYSIFVPVQGNRKTDKNHVEALAKSIRKTAVVSPVLVKATEHGLEPWDGQHRVLACQLLGIPVPFILIKLVAEFRPQVDEVGTVAILNSGQKNWTLEDFMENFLEQDLQDYVYLNEFIQRHNLAISTALGIVMGHGVAGHSGSASRLFKSGELTVPDEAWEKAEDYMAMINEIRNYYPGYEKFKDSNRFLAALYHMVSHPLYDHDYFFSKLTDRASLIVSCPTIEAFLIVFADIYNVNRKARNRIDFTENLIYSRRSR